MKNYNCYHNSNGVDTIKVNSDNVCECSLCGARFKNLMPGDIDEICKLIPQVIDLLETYKLIITDPKNTEFKNEELKELATTIKNEELKEVATTIKVLDNIKENIKEIFERR